MSIIKPNMHSLQSKLSLSPNYRIYSIFAILLLIISSLNKTYKPDNIDYLVYCLFIFISIVNTIDRRKFIVPHNYAFILLLLLFVMIINAFVTDYSVSPKYFAIGVILSCIPFIHFIISYNYNLAFSEIIHLMDRLVLAIVLLGIFIIAETIFNGWVGLTGFLSTKIFMIGFMASLFIQGLILSLGLYHLKKDNKYKRIAFFLIVLIVLTNQLKALSCMLLIVGIYFLLLRKARKSRQWGLTILIIVCSFQVLLFIPKVQEKVVRYTEIYGSESAKDGIARVAMYYTAVKIADDYFPFGSGQGTYGSIASNLSKNDKIYDDYGLSGIWGMSRYDDMDFRMDAYGASVLGEQGYIGTILYLMLLFFPFTYLMKKTKNNPNRKFYLFVSGLSIIVIIIQSLSLSLMNRFSFVFCYSGISAMLIRVVEIQHIQISRKGMRRK